MANEGDADSLWNKLFSILFTRWWAGLLLGPAILAGGAYLLLGVVEAPWVELRPIEIYEEVLQGLCGLGLALVGLSVLSAGFFNLLFGCSDGANLPFRIEIRDGVVIFDCFSPFIHRYYGDVERELPVVRDAVARLAGEGRARFVFDLRTAELASAYPIAKWGAMYGALSGLRVREPSTHPAALAKNVKLVGGGELLHEIRIYGLDRLFECFDTLEAAIESFRVGAELAKPSPTADPARDSGSGSS